MDVIPMGGAEDDLYRHDYDDMELGTTSVLPDSDPYAHLGYHACCVACMLRITVPVFCYGQRCTCIYHVECLSDTEFPTQCTHHGIGHHMSVCSPSSSACILGCGKLSTTPDANAACDLCHEKVKSAVIRTVLLLKGGSAPVKPRFLMHEDSADVDMDAPKPTPTPKQSDGAFVQLVYAVLMRNIVLWPEFFGHPNVITETDIDMTTHAPTAHVHPMVHVMWRYVLHIIREDPPFHISDNAIWLTALWIESGFLRLPVCVYPYPSVIETLDEYHVCTKDKPESTIAMIWTLLRAHLRASESVLMLRSDKIRKTTPLNIYSRARLVTEVQKAEYGDIRLSDVYKEDVDVHKFIEDLTESGEIAVIGYRLYPLGTIPTIPGFADKLGKPFERPSVT